MEIFFRQATTQEKDVYKLFKSARKNKYMLNFFKT
jgi:hypothetical protein